MQSSNLWTLLLTAIIAQCVGTDASSFSKFISYLMYRVIIGGCTASVGPMSVKMKASASYVRKARNVQIKNRFDTNLMVMSIIKGLYLTPIKLSSYLLTTNEETNNAKSTVARGISC